MRHSSKAMAAELLAHLTVWKKMGNCKGMCMAAIAPFISCTLWLAELRQAGRRHPAAA